MKASEIEKQKEEHRKHPHKREKDEKREELKVTDYKGQLVGWKDNNTAK